MLPPPMMLVPLISQIATSPLLLWIRDVGFAVVVVIADPHDMPARPRVSDAAAADHGGAVSGIAACLTARAGFRRSRG
jgi:hypothetical protein